MQRTIQTLKDVEEFAKTLAAEGTIFHPDDDFSSYVRSGSNKIAFSPTVAQEKNVSMKACFEVCNNEKVNIYDFMLEIRLKETGLDSYIPLPSKVL